MEEVHNHHNEDYPEFEYNQINDWIYIGTNQCCKTHFEESLLKKGVTAVVSLEAERVDAPFGVESYLWLPTKNGFPPSPDSMHFGISHLAELKKLGKKVYVHCRNGHGRAPTLIAGFLVVHEGMSPEEAVAFLKRKRPMVHLTEDQMEALTQLK